MIVHMIGNAHIDPVWLWRWQAGVDEALATFRSAADRCEEYPAFVFTRGESWLYEQVERLAPDLFERVREHVKSGQWHITGGQYLQPDANLPTETGWRRQIVHGRRYFEDRFGVRPNIGYNVDTFGHPTTLPDLLTSLGHIAYVFHRPGASQMNLPSQNFRCAGREGARSSGSGSHPTTSPGPYRGTARHAPCGLPQSNARWQTEACPAHERGDPEIKCAPGADLCGDNGPLLPGSSRTRDT